MLSPDVTWCVEGAWETPGTGPASSGSLQGSIPGLPTLSQLQCRPSSVPGQRIPIHSSQGPTPTQPRVHLSHPGPTASYTEAQAMVTEATSGVPLCHWHVPGPLGSSRDDRAVLLESGWWIWKNGQNKPRGSGLSSFLQWPWGHWLELAGSGEEAQNTPAPTFSHWPDALVRRRP